MPEEGQKHLGGWGSPGENHNASQAGWGVRSPVMEVNKLQSEVPSVKLGPHQSQEQVGEAGRSTATSAFLHTPQVGRETRGTLPDN